MLEHLSDNNVLTGLVWVYELETHEPNFIDWIAHLKRTHRRLSFMADDGKIYHGYCRKLSTLYEPFALWIKELYGDGVYYVETKGDYYFLIISDGLPVSGSDCVVSQRFWATFKEQLKDHPRYQQLAMKELTQDHIIAVVERCVAKQLRSKKRRQLVIAALAVGGVIFLMLFIALLKFFIRG